ncbi:hypothetical protein BCR39DRAFT_560102 [Naematelia encephala]|uniref:RRM domain-containing protein n=1 Tax=Naematelia encephala TaxID=71784 RepID=A0A1Y2AY03_9TREE|nr:hypothetical protein BCR39DRAFT_560102 [Naematelia encephala]
MSTTLDKVDMEGYIGGGFAMSAEASASSRGRSPGPGPQISLPPGNGAALVPSRSYSPSRPPTSAEIDAVIAAAMANAPPVPSQPDFPTDDRANTPLMTNLLPAAVGADGRVNLFIGNLPYRVRWQDLKDLFRKAGTVLRADVSLGPDNRSRGYGTVLMGSREDAARAIDRFNGYTWQTRTLEVRPDRLPAEYEPQPHIHHNAVRPPGPFQSMPGPHPSFPMPNHFGPGWHPPNRPSSHFAGPGSQQMLGVMSMPGSGPHAPPMGVTGSSPIPSTRSPAPGFGSLPLPLSGQNTGSTPYPIHPSPLAGSLTAGVLPSQPNGADLARRDSLSPFAHPPQPDASHAPHPSSSITPALPQPTSRPPSRTELRGSPHSDAPQAQPQQPHRAPPPGSLGPLPPPLFAGVKAVISPSESGFDTQSNSSIPAIARGITPPPHIPPVGPPPAVPINLEGLAHQAPGLGPPGNLHDRVLFVYNLPLSMQWQELKDMLRPAGIIIRADVATDEHNRPRGFGTALFATVADAAKAVHMFNDREIGGHRIQVHLESEVLQEGRRSSFPHDHARHMENNYAPPEGPLHHDQSSRPELSILQTAGSIPGPTTSASPIRNVPWGLNTSINGAHSTPIRGQEGSPIPHFRQTPHHPGPLAMPSFSSMDNGFPLSPLQTRGLPPMTPSMPGFVFNAYPETPPVPLHFLSPGIGPFSPGIPVTSPGGFPYNPFLNAAPGGPVNPYPAGGSAALGTPTTQTFPNSPVHGYGGPSALPNISQTLSNPQPGDYFPQIGQMQDGPSSPTTRVASRSSITGPSPLNAKDRLAPNAPAPAPAPVKTEVEELVGKTGSLTVRDGVVSGSHLNLPPLKKANGDGVTEGEDVRIRASLDTARPAVHEGGLLESLGIGGERRASFGDIGSGRDGR